MEKRICLKNIEKKWKKIKKHMRVCEKCGLVLSSQYSLDKHFAKQVPCVKKDLKLSLIDLQKDFLNKDKIIRKKFILQKEVLCEKLGISVENDILLSEKPIIFPNNENLENLSNEELLIIIKEKMIITH